MFLASQDRARYRDWARLIIADAVSTDGAVIEAGF